MGNKIGHMEYAKKCTGKLILSLFFISLIISCQKDLELTSGISEPKQAIIANLYPGNRLEVNISKSKHPDDFNPIDFLNNCKVDLYEDGIFKETMPFVLRDTLSGLGYYTSSFNIQPNKTYKIISAHAALGVAEAEEYVPNVPRVLNYNLYQHADIAHPNMMGKYVILFQDNAERNDYYFISTIYRIYRPIIDNTGDTVYRYDYLYNIPSYIPGIPNPSNFNRSYTTDASFNGQLMSFTVEFPSQYNNNYKEILLIIELSGCGKNFYDWNTQQIPMGTDYLNDGQMERINLKGNVVNGYGHFTANSSVFIGIPIK